MMKHNVLLVIFLLMSWSLQAQQWVDTLFPIQTTTDVIYGSTVDFAGNERELAMDISVPVGDTLPTCGRPLMLLIHGGAFIAGNKEAHGVSRMREDFAKRGYVSVAVNYRLGMFQTHQAINCNISALGAEWNCLNMADSSEWYRAYFRAVQDVNGAIRYLVNHADDYDIDPQHVFVVGESAGGFIAMGVGYIDDATEVLSDLTDAKADALPPNNIYEMKCVQGYGLDTSITSMALSRPDLGSFKGTLNFPPARPYRIRAVGNFYGAVFNNIFASQQAHIPALYLFHQPNDLLVPYGHNRIFGGYAHCATQFPFSCQYIINRPHVYGSNGIKSLIDDMTASQVAAPDYLFEHTNNNAPCAIQIANPSTSGHAIDNYWLRTTSMATYFAGKVDSCTAMSIANELSRKPQFSIAPNPISRQAVLHIQADCSPGDMFSLFDIAGKKLLEQKISLRTEAVKLDLSELNLTPGLYLIQMKTPKGTFIKKLSTF